LEPSSTSVQNNFISARENLPEFISELFKRLIAAHQCFPTRCLNNLRPLLAAKMQRNFISVSDVVTCEIKH